MMISSVAANTGHAACGMTLQNDYVRLLVSAAAVPQSADEIRDG